MLSSLFFVRSGVVGHVRSATAMRMAFRKKEKVVKSKDKQLKAEKAEIAAKKSWVEREFDPWAVEVTKRFTKGVF
jgi:hypothetical protein